LKFVNFKLTKNEHLEFKPNSNKGSKKKKKITHKKAINSDNYQI
jgi:hypothetical protein